jgi:F0F1-type ATP synthase delta subunit
MGVAATYAEALFEAAEAQSAVDQVRTELREFSEAMAPGTELRAVLTSPEIETPAKKAAVSDLM